MLAQHLAKISINECISNTAMENVNRFAPTMMNLAFICSCRDGYINFTIGMVLVDGPTLEY